MKRIRLSQLLLLLVLFSCSRIESNVMMPLEDSFAQYVPENIKSYPAPEGADLSNLYQVKVEGISVPVYNLKVAPKDETSRWAAMDDKINSHTYYDTAAFAYFDRKNTVEVAITVPHSISSVKILPTSAGITPVITGQTIKFTVSKAEKLTIEVNENWVSALHLFANDFETDIPDPNDPNVMYFGPGIHQVSGHQLISTNKTVYIAGGAIVKAVIDPSESYTISGDNLPLYEPTFTLQGDNIKVRGRGILDGSACTNHSRRLIRTTGQHISVEGIILQNAPVWTVEIMNSGNVTVDNVKLLGYRANSDGIDICNSTDVSVKNCFLRTLDDLVVVKTRKEDNGKSERILVENCTLWNEVAHALSIGAETAYDVNDVTFRNCDIIHDKGREWALRVFQAGMGRTNNVRFENIRIEESKKLISLWIGENGEWSPGQDCGNISNITFNNVAAMGTPSTVELIGYDATHKVEGVTFENLLINGSSLQPSQVAKNEYVSVVTIIP